MTILLTLAVLTLPAQAPAPEAPPAPQHLPEAPSEVPPQSEGQDIEQLPPGLVVPTAPTTGPAACVTRALAETMLSEHESVLLCQSARSAEPVDCFREADQHTFLQKHDILSLCSPTLSGRVPFFR